MPYRRLFASFFRLIRSGVGVLVEQRGYECFGPEEILILVPGLALDRSLYIWWWELIYHSHGETFEILSEEMMSGLLGGIYVVSVSHVLRNRGSI